MDEGWKNDHDSRSWQLLGLQKFGPLVEVEESKPPYQNTRRLISRADVRNDPKHAHNAVIPGGGSPKDKSGRYVYDDVWRYAFTHPTDAIGKPIPADPAVRMNQRNP